VRGDEQEPDKRCGTSGTSGHVTAKSSIREVGVLYKSGVYAWKILCLTPGGLQNVPMECMAEMMWHRRETRRQTEKTNIGLKHRRGLDEGKPESNELQESAEGVVGIEQAKL